MLALIYVRGLSKLFVVVNFWTDQLVSVTAPSLKALTILAIFNVWSQPLLK